MANMYPWEVNASRWDESQFSVILRGDDYYKARCIMQDAMEAVQSGRIRYWFPSPGVSVDQTHVDKAVNTIDYEWEQESRRDRKRTGGPGFMQQLTSEQRSCLVERLSEVCP